jgi:hypothetical protein
MGGTRLGTTEDSKVLGVECEGVDRIYTVELDTRSVHRHSKRCGIMLVSSQKGGGNVLDPTLSRLHQRQAFT